MYKQYCLAKPDISYLERETVISILDSGRLSMGEYTEKFEKAMADFLGVKYAVAVNSGTSGLHLAIKSLGISKGDEVITTSFSFVASANCILYEGARPVFVDIDRSTYNIDVSKIERSITSRTKAILPVHVFGTPVNMDPLRKIAEKYNLKVIEDACEALGSEYNNKKVGSLSDISVFAFYPNKQITTGEGGMVLTNSLELYSLCKSMRNQGRDEQGEWLNHIRLGFNYRMSELNAGLGYAQLTRFPELYEKRARVASYYDELIEECYPFVRKPQFTKKSWFVYVVEVEENRDELMSYLNENGIQSRKYFSPIHTQPFYKEQFQYQEGILPVTEEVSERVIALPFYNDMTRDDVRHIVDIIKTKVIKGCLK
jgi:perosamine synthetase